MKSFYEMLVLAEQANMASAEKFPQVQSDFSKSAGEVPVLVLVARLDSAWKRDGEYYIRPFENSPKYRAARKLVDDGGPLNMPRVGLDVGMMRVGFDDGRHTFAVLRDMGSKEIYVSVDPSQRDGFLAEFGPSGSKK